MAGELLPPQQDPNALPPEQDPAMVPEQNTAPQQEEPDNLEAIPEELQKALLDLLLEARREDEQVRWNYLQLWKKLEYYWENILDIFFDPISRDWRVPDWSELESEIPPRLINIYRPHGEAIVAALSVDIPAVIFHPDDADNPDDVEAAHAMRNISDLLALHNDAPMLFVRAMTIMFNQGTIFGYNYYHTDPKFGTYSKPKIESQDVEIFHAFCPQCGAPLDAGAKGMQEGMYQCEICGYQGPGQIEEGTESLPQIVGFDKSPKGSVCQEIFSGLNVKVSSFVKKQEECGYIELEFNQSTAMLRSIYQDQADKINSRIDSGFDDKFFKLPLQYFNQTPDNSSNVSCIWFRPWFFWQLGGSKVEIIKQLLKQFPDGCYAVFINDEFMDAFPENMDDHWTISKNPMGKFIYARPLGENLATVQNIRGDLVEIELQTAEFGIPETFADPKVLDFDKYGKGRAQPGMVTQAVPRPGKSLQDAFLTTKTATLSQEIDPIRQHIDQDAQFVVGSFPSVYGGPSEGGSKTASEYSQSRAIALQRLGSVWKIMCDFWADFQARSSIEYADTIKDLGQDEKFTKREGVNSFINVWIRISALSGRIGRVEPEASEQLPTSWAQKHDSVMQLIQTGVPEILQVLVHPRNATFMKNATGLKELYIPGEEARIRQQKEFQILSQGVPVPVNQLVDDHAIHAEVLKTILEGIQGESLDDMAMQVSMQHLQEHEFYNQQAAMAAQEQESNNANPADKKKEKVTGNE